MSIPWNNILSDITQEIIKNLEWTAEFIRNEAVKVVRVDTGRLRASITINKLNDFNIEVGSNVEYASEIEEGTSKHPAYPYLRPALEKGKSEFKRKIDMSIDKIMRKYFD